MQTLNIKQGDIIMIGDDTEVVVLSVLDEQVELGITSPHVVSVNENSVSEIDEQNEGGEHSVCEHSNDELYEQIKQFNRESLRRSGLDIVQNMFLVDVE